MQIGFLHPGLMGHSLAASCIVPGLFASDGRSSDTVERAQGAGLVDAGSLAQLCADADVVVSICPPAAALALASDVAATGFDGTYVDANAISPAAARDISGRFDHFVDASVIGPPAWNEGTTRLYVSGERADEIAALWTGSVLDARVLEGAPGQASALKMAYASWTKIGAALQLGIRSLAATEGVEDALLDEWSISQPGLAERTEHVASAVGPKAWRFTGEMEQIAATFGVVGLPSGFADAAADVYQRLAGFKGETPQLHDVVTALGQSKAD